MKDNLLRMGYRELKPGTWVKPMGYVIAIYLEKENKWSSYFKGEDGDIHLYTSMDVDTMTKLKDAEAYTPVSMGSPDSTFELGVPIEKLL